jgi:F-type H+-transporting ATPase subunit a
VTPLLGTVPAANIKVGDHITAHWFGWTWNVDTIYSTVLAGAIVVILGLVIARGISSGVPNKLQLTYEVVVDQVRNQVEDAIGPVAPWTIPLAITLFLFILFCNWLSILPTLFHDREYIPPATADTNTTFAMSLLVFVLFTYVGIKHRGFGHYVKGFFKPLPLAPIKLIEEVAKPLSLSLRLFGNIFAGGVMVAVIGLFPAYLLWAPTALWKAFDMFIGLIQAFIFAFLSILYFSFAVSEEH